MVMTPGSDTVPQTHTSQKKSSYVAFTSGLD